MLRFHLFAFVALLLFAISRPDDLTIDTMDELRFRNPKVKGTAELALGAIHQGQRQAGQVTFLKAPAGERVGQFVQGADHMQEFVSGPIIANYPNGTPTTAEGIDEATAGWKT